MTGEIGTLDRQFNLRLTATEEEAIREMARQEGRTMSDFIRRTLRQSLFLAKEGPITPLKGEERPEATDVTPDAYEERAQLLPGGKSDA